MGLTEKQLAMRRTGITATDVRVLAGLDPYGRTPHDVWRSKVLGDEAMAETEAMSIGSELEPMVLRRLAKKVGLFVLPVDPELLTMRHAKVAHHLATPDALLAPTRLHDPEAIAQVKVVGLRAAAEWADADDAPDGVPDHVLTQCAWELYVSGHVVEHVGALLGTEVRAYRIELTPDVASLIEALREVADRFWRDHVVTNRPPAIDGSEGARRMLKALFPKVTVACVQADAQADQLVRDYFERKTAVAQAEQRLEETRQLLITACGSAEGIVGEGWRLLYKHREGYEVTPKPYTVPAGRHFDLRKVEPKGAARPRRSGREAA